MITKYHPWAAGGMALFLTMVSIRAADVPAPARPRILGVAQVALYVHDVATARKFYRDFLGFEEPLALNNPDGSLRAALIKVADRQTIELLPETAPATDRLNHFSLETDDVEAMRLYLKSRGIAVPDQVTKGTVTTAFFQVKDPDGHIVEFMQFGPGSWTVKDTGQHLPATRLSPRISHAGILVRHLDAALKFYGDILGCTETWRGSGNGQVLSWVTMKVPDGNDWVEFMLYDKMPALASLGISHHLCLEVPDLASTAKILAGRTVPAGAVLSDKISVGVNRRRQLRVLDPDGTRVELMEAHTVDGQPAPSSTAPPPN
jgi:catechol 2,3-dioxygenase-like lactoylglutathione lyase family enzyme